ENAEVVWARSAPGAGTLEGSFAVRAWGGAADERAWRVLLRPAPDSPVPGRTAAQGRSAVPREGARVAFRAGDRPAGAAGAEIALDPDGLAEDDRFYFPVAGAREFSALVVVGAPGLSPVKDEAYYFRPALEGLRAQGLALTVVAQENWREQDGAAYDVIVLLNPAPLSPGRAARLEDHLRRGGGLWVTCGNNAESLREWERLLPARPGGVLDGVRTAAPPRAGESPVAEVLAADGGFEWGKVRVEKMLEVEPKPGARVFLRTEDGRPLLVEGPVLGGRSALLATTADRDWTNLPGKPLFPVLCREMILHLAGRAEGGKGFTLVVGEPFQQSVDKGLSTAVDILRPDGVVEQSPVRAGRVSYERTDAPGFYSVRERGAAGRAPLFFAVNLDRESGEGNLARVDKEKVSRLLPARDLVWASHAEPPEKKFRDRVQGKDLTPPLAAAVLLLFALETVAGLRRRT
ncbi:MAG: hypothetical protein ACT4O3_09730, partial [Elusimicrobiota bacterium]